MNDKQRARCAEHVVEIMNRGIAGDLFCVRTLAVMVLLLNDMEERVIQRLNDDKE